MWNWHHGIYSKPNILSLFVRNYGSLVVLTYFNSSFLEALRHIDSKLRIGYLAV